MAASKNTDLAPRRQDRLLELLAQRGAVRLSELCRELGASPATVRRDLKELEAGGRVRRVHGGAVSVGTHLEEPLFDDKAAIAAREKRRIAEAALKLVGHGETVYIDGGSTVLELARLLRDRSDVTVVTNSLRAALELAVKGPRLILVGGEVRRLSQTLVGPLTAAVLGQLRPEKAFMGTMGMELDGGLTTSDPGEAQTKRLAVAASRQVVLLAHSAKAGQSSFVRFGDLSEVDVLITDSGLGRAFGARLAKLGIRVIKV